MKTQSITLWPDDQNAIIASARKIIADADNIKNENRRRELQLEAATILKLMGVAK